MNLTDSTLLCTSDCVSTYIELVRDRKIKRPLLSGSLKMMAAWPVKECGLGTDGRPLCGTPN